MNNILSFIHTSIDLGILTAVVITARKLARLEFMVELMWEEFHQRQNKED